MMLCALSTVAFLNHPARRAWVYFFSASHRKEITKNPLCVLSVLNEHSEWAVKISFLFDPVNPVNPV